MGISYSTAELEEFTEEYRNIKLSVENFFEEEEDTLDEVNKKELSDIALAKYDEKIHYDKLEDYAKLAEAAYIQVEHKVEDKDWRDVQDRIANYTLWRDNGHRQQHEMTVYLPSKYTTSATREIVKHSIVLDLTTDE